MKKVQRGPLPKKLLETSLEDYLEIRYGRKWYEFPEVAKAAKEAHAKTFQACKAAFDYHHTKPARPLEVLAIHGSLRSDPHNCAHEDSNSKLLLEYGLKPFEDAQGVNITRVDIRDYEIETCNGCYSSASAHCAWPCNCWPLDPMQILYPLVIKCDVMLISTGVYQSDMSGPLSDFCQRLISADGGHLVRPDQYGSKDLVWKMKRVALEQALDFEYVARLHGRVGAWFISSKDQRNPHDQDMDYAGHVAKTLRKGFADYGMSFPTKDDVTLIWGSNPPSMFQGETKDYAIAAGDPNLPMSSDKQTLHENVFAQKESQKLVGRALAMGKYLYANPAEAPKKPGRFNRT